MNKEKNNKSIEELDFETALKKLEKIVEKLGSGNVNLEEMVEIYKEGILLKDHCSKKLQDAKMKVDILLTNEK